MSRSESLLVAALVCLVACAYALYGLFRHWHFGSSAFDLGIFDQAVWHMSRFQAPASSISGFSNILGDHFYPIITFFVPLYWVAPAPETLIVAQAFLLAGSIVPVFLFLRMRLPRGHALALCVAYGLFWGLQRGAAFDVHEMAFAPLIIAAAVLAFDQARWGLFWGATLALGLVKEDLIPVLTFLGLYLVVRGERRRGTILVVASLVAFLMVVGIAIPSFSDSGQYAYAGAYGDILRRPWTIPLTMVTPPAKLQTAFLWVAPFVFLPLVSPLSVLLVPLAIERFLSNSPTHWSTLFHYSVPLAPILAMSAGDGLARFARRIDSAGTRARLMAGLVGASVLLSSILPGRQPLWRLFSPGHYHQTAVQRTGYEALRLIPKDASVVAQAAVAPHLSQRNQIYMLDPKAPDAEFVIAAASLSPWPGATYAELASLIRDRQRRGYLAIFEQNGWVVLRRGDSRGALPMR